MKNSEEVIETTSTETIETRRSQAFDVDSFSVSKKELSNVTFECSPSRVLVFLATPPKR
ncbi:hypothetical protein YC2023_079108 [Brassica napus]